MRRRSSNLTFMLGAWTGYIVPVIIILIVLALAAAVAIMRKMGTRTTSSPYEACPPLTPAERSFWQVLQQCLPEAHVLLTKVRLADIVNVKKGFDAKTRHPPASTSRLHRSGRRQSRNVLLSGTTPSRHHHTDDNAPP